MLLALRSLWEAPIEGFACDISGQGSFFPTLRVTGAVQPGTGTSGGVGFPYRRPLEKVTKRKVRVARIRFKQLGPLVIEGNTDITASLRLQPTLRTFYAPRAYRHFRAQFSSEGDLQAEPIRLQFHLRAHLSAPNMRYRSREEQELAEVLTAILKL